MCNHTLAVNGKNSEGGALPALPGQTAICVASGLLFVENTKIMDTIPSFWQNQRDK